MVLCAGFNDSVLDGIENDSCCGRLCLYIGDVTEYKYVIQNEQMCFFFNTTDIGDAQYPFICRAVHSLISHISPHASLLLNENPS